MVASEGGIQGDFSSSVLFSVLSKCLIFTMIFRSPFYRMRSRPNKVNKMKWDRRTVDPRAREAHTYLDTHTQTYTQTHTIYLMACAIKPLTWSKLAYRCNGLNVWVPPKPVFQNSHFQCDEIWRWDFGG